MSTDFYNLYIYIDYQDKNIYVNFLGILITKNHKITTDVFTKKLPLVS